jgi:hypothetical protein
MPNLPDPLRRTLKVLRDATNPAIVASDAMGNIWALVVYLGAVGLAAAPSEWLGTLSHASRTAGVAAGLAFAFFAHAYRLQKSNEELGAKRDLFTDVQAKLNEVSKLISEGSGLLRAYSRPGHESHHDVSETRRGLPCQDIWLPDSDAIQ